MPFVIIISLGQTKGNRRRVGIYEEGRSQRHRNKLRSSDTLDNILRQIEMDSAQRDPRDMTSEEAMAWMQELVNSLAAEKGSAGGACSLEALKNPIRRNILNALEEKALAISDISERVGVSGAALRFHLNFLESSYFIRIEGNRVDLTPGGVSVVRSGKRT